MQELHRYDFKRVEHFFFNSKRCIPALSVIHGNYPGRVFVDNNEEPTVAIVWAIGRWMYLEGKPSSHTHSQVVNSFLQETVVPDCKMRDENWFEIYTSDEGRWDNFFLDETNQWRIQKHYESVYTLNLTTFQQLKRKMRAEAEKLDLHFLEYDILPETYHQLPYLIDEFKIKKCFGVAIKNHNQTVTICKNNGFTFGNEYFIDVDTFLTEERGKGYATAAAIHLIDYLLDQKCYPLWETTHQNIPSHKLATKLGFEVQENYPVYSFVND